MIVGLALALLGGMALYYALTGLDPIDAIRRSAIGAPPAVKLGITTPTEVTGGFTAPGQATLPLQAAIIAIKAMVAAMPGRQLNIGSICRPGAIVAGTSSASEHSKCNAVDFTITRDGRIDRKAMDRVYAVLAAAPHCEACWNFQGGCTTSHTDHIHYAPLPCRT